MTTESARSPMTPLGPLVFEPVLKSYVWGGRNLEKRLGRALPPGKTAESWEISDHPNGETRVARGPFRGSPLQELLGTYGTRLVGNNNQPAVDRKRFPLLIKLLDANDWLSVQVHPDDEYARVHEGDLGKTEMWVVLEAERDAEIILGFDRPTDASALEEALERGDLSSLLHRVPARAGDVFFVPAGTVHAIGPGLLLAEIQQTSDVTYRVYDWNRKDDGDTGRDLHVKQALEVADFAAVRPGAVEPLVIEPGRELIAECPLFRTERLRLSGGGFSGECDGSTFEIWATLSGQAAIESNRGRIDLAAVSWTLLPAELGTFEVVASGEAELLRVVTPPG